MIIPSLSDNLMTLLSPLEVARQIPVTNAQATYIESSRHQIKAILNGQDPRLLLIIGPCSIHDTLSALEYAENVSKLSQIVSDQFFLIMRVYFDKARSTVGWPGFASDPHINGSHDMAAGIHLTRKLLLELAEMQVPAAAELLNPISVQYFKDLLSWGCIGARTTESQTHRQLASSLTLPVAFKNSTSGNIEAAINGAISASSPHSFLGLNCHGQPSVVNAEGNEDAHIVLRGAEDSTNYDFFSIKQALSGLRRAGLPERVLIDCSHGNSCRQHTRQAHVFQSVIEQVLAGNTKIRGLCVESHLNEGSQPIPEDRKMLKHGISITDACIGWEETETLVLSAHKALMENSLVAT